MRFRGNKLLSLQQRESGYKKSFIQRILPAQYQMLSLVRLNRSLEQSYRFLGFSVMLAAWEGNSYQHIEHLLILKCFPPCFVENQIYEKHNHNMRALLFYYQWVLLLEAFEMICHMGTNIIYKPLMTCKHSSSLRCRMTVSHSVCSARISAGTCTLSE